ncbi:hypothetical protein G6F55_014532 [Rhizopus delemar]|nr:hypothetical protein G6F55_014532 [Rhizopus delemar]
MPKPCSAACNIIPASLNVATGITGVRRPAALNQCCHISRSPSSGWRARVSGELSSSFAAVSGDASAISGNGISNKGSDSTPAQGPRPNRRAA